MTDKYDQSQLRSSERSGMENVVAFPRDKIFREQTGTLTEEQLLLSEMEIHARITLMKTLHVQEVIEALMPIVFSQLSIGGFDLSDETDIKDAAFITEAIRSVLCKHKGIEHPFQQLADKIFLDEDNGILSVVESININFKQQAEEELEELAPVL